LKSVAERGWLDDMGNLTFKCFPARMVPLEGWTDGEGRRTAEDKQLKIHP
jgi:hypothetical protein